MMLSGLWYGEPVLVGLFSAWMSMPAPHLTRCGGHPFVWTAFIHDHHGCNSGLQYGAAARDHWTLPTKLTMSANLMAEPPRTRVKRVHSSVSFFEGIDTSGPVVSMVKPSHALVCDKAVLCQAIGSPIAASVPRMAMDIMTAESALKIQMKSST
jgi:hypothetical protein